MCGNKKKVGRKTTFFSTSLCVNGKIIAKQKKERKKLKRKRRINENLCAFAPSLFGIKKKKKISIYKKKIKKSSCVCV